MRTIKTYEELANEAVYIQSWMASMLKSTKSEGFVIGISGGFDSAFAAYLASSPVCAGSGNIYALLMPCDSSPDSLTDGYDVCEKLHIFCNEIDLKSIVEALTKKIIGTKSSLQPTKTDIGNIKARLRMTVLYYYASRLSYLVLNTTNKSEAMTGNGTKFGDCAGDISPFGNYTKTELYRMAQATGFSFLFPQLMEKVPTADLEPGQTDEKTMGISYEVLDEYLLGLTHTETGKKIVFSKEVVQHIENLKMKSAHKRNPIPTFAPCSN